MSNTEMALLYCIPILLIFASMYCHVYLDKGPEYDRVSKGGLIAWFVVAFIPVLNIVVALGSVCAIFSIKSVTDWLGSPVKRN